MFRWDAQLVTSSLSISLSWRTQLKKQYGWSPVVYGVLLRHVIIFTKIYLFKKKKNPKGNVDKLCDVITWRHIPEGGDLYQRVVLSG